MGGLRERVRREVAQAAKRQAVAKAARGHYLARMRQWARLAQAGRLQNLRDRARDAKDEVLGRHSQYLAQFTQAVEARGGRVHFAATEAEAVGRVLAIVREHGAKLAVKSKSMVSEEIGLTPALEAAGVEAVETDLGEYIIQLAGHPPAHIVGPAIHMTRRDVADLFARKLGRPMPEDPEMLTAVAREVLREKFLSAQVGITGANFAVAETGTVVLLTNEGNGRMVTSLPPVLITVMGLEKLVPTWEALEPLLTLLPRSSTGQNVTVYVSAITGPRQTGELDGPQEWHVVVLDAGRSRLLGTRYQDALRCIRCGACLNACPVFRVIGGHGYGTTYSGPIGITITGLLKGMAPHSDLLDACSLCGACTEVCPVQIPLHHFIRDQKTDRARAGLVQAVERLLFRLWGWAWSHPVRYRLSLRLARWLAVPFVRDGYLTWGPGPLAEWMRGRDFPAPAARTFRDRWPDLAREEGMADGRTGPRA